MIAEGDHALSIAILADGVAPYVLGGMQQHTRMLAIHLARAGANVALFHSARSEATADRARTLADFPADVLGLIRNVVVPYPRQGRLPGHYLRENAAYSRALLQSYRNAGFAADFIYAQGLTGTAFTAARRSCPQAVPPVGVNQHGYEMFQHAADLTTYLQHVMLRAAFARLARDADWVFSFPARIRQIVEHKCGVPSDRIIEIPNAIDRSWIVHDRPPPPARRRFVFVGRYERRKGVPELLRAIAQLPNDGWEFHFVGPIPPEAQLPHACVTYHGPISDTARLQSVLDQCDVLVCPSFAEGMPTVVLEAMARGLAVIATDVGATSAWVSDANGQLLTSPCGAELPAALKQFLSIPQPRLHTLQHNSKKKAEQYTWEHISQAVLFSIRNCVIASPR